MKLLNSWKKTDEKFHDTGFSNDFLGMTSKAQATKDVYKLDQTRSKLKTAVRQRGNDR